MLTDAERESLTDAFRKAAWLDGDVHEWAAFEDDAHHHMTPVIERILAARETALREEIAAAIEAQRGKHWMTRPPGPRGKVDPYDYGKHDAYYDAARIARQATP